MKHIVYILAGMGISVLVKALGFDGGSWQYWLIAVIASVLLVLGLHINDF